jgi:hypothetical protein
MSSIIINSFYRALTNIDENEGIKNVNVQQLTRLLVDQLYPEDGVLVWENEDTLKIRRTPVVQTVTVPMAPAEPVVAPVVAPVVEVKEVKVKEVKPKLTKEEKAAEKAAKDAAKAAKVKVKVTPEPVPAPAPEPVALVPEPVPAPVPEAPKVKEVKVKEPKAKFVGNLEKLNPTQDKLLKKTAADGNVHFAIDTKVKFIAFMNAMDNKDFNSKKMEEHMKAFFAPKAPVVEEIPGIEMDYKGKTYLVDPSNGDVYESSTQEDGSVIDKKVGKVGLLDFADMVVPVE